MLYHPPTGAATTNDGYVGKNVAAGIQGSKIPPKAVEAPQRELVNAILATGQTPTDNDFTQVAQAISTGLYLGVFGGTANALTASLSPLAPQPGVAATYQIPALVAGMRFHGVIGPSANTGAATLNLGGFATAAGSVTILRKDGKAALAANDLAPGVLTTFEWDGAAFRHVGPTRSDMAAIVAALAPLYTNSAILYVRYDANGTNPSGQSNSISDAFPTVDAALAFGLKSYYFPSGGLTIQLGVASTPNTPATYYTPPANGIGAAPGSVAVRGDPANQGSYIFSGAGPAAGNGAIFQFSSVTATLIGVTLANTGSLNHTLGAGSNASVNIQNVTFQKSATSIFAQIFAGSNSVINILAGCTSATGNTNGNLFNASYGGTITMFANIYVGPASAIAFGIVCLTAVGGRFVRASGNPVFVGFGATGQRYRADTASVIATSGAGANFFPGSTAGDSPNGGVYQ